MSRIPMGDAAPWGEENAGRTLLGDRKLPGEADFLRWGLFGPAFAGDIADNSRLPDDRPLKKQRTRAPNNDVDTTIPVDNCPPIEPVVPPAGSRSAARTTRGDRDLSNNNNNLLLGILDIFPDIDHQYVYGLLAAHHTLVSNDGPYTVATSTRIKEDLVERILAQTSYPKQEKPKRKPEQPGDDQDQEKWEVDAKCTNDPSYFQNACDVLSQEFLRVPVTHIRQVMSQKKGLYAAYLTIHRQELSPLEPDMPYSRLKKPRTTDQRKVFKFGDLKELHAAERQAQKESFALLKRKEDEEMERRNEEESTRAGTLVECQCCYADIPLNRAMPCEGETAHFFCFTCIRKSAETQIGLMKWRLQCFDTSGCQEQFNRSRLEHALGSSLMKKLDSLQQEDEIQQACLEGLESCPFCDFKAICGPVEENREFHCQKPSCEIVSCRLCKAESHIPKTCQEARKEKGLPERHAVEEAMSEALIRNCPKCKVKIIKEYGCNRVSCSKCGCHMCYLCKKDISKEVYNHFNKPPTYCRTHDDYQKTRDQDEVDRAQATAISQALSQNPNLTENDLLVHASTKKKASVATPNPRLAVPVDQPFQQAYQEVRNAHRIPHQHPFQPQHTPPVLPVLPTPGNHQLFQNLPPLYHEHWKGDGLNIPHGFAFPFPQQEHRRPAPPVYPPANSQGILLPNTPFPPL